MYKKILITCIIMVMLVLPVMGYTYTYGQPKGSGANTVCVKSNYVAGASDFWAAWFTNDTTVNIPNNPSAATLPFNSTYWTTTQTNHWLNPTSQCYYIPTTFSTVFITQNNGTAWDYRYGDFYYNGSAASVLFSISQEGSYSTKLSGVVVTISNSQTNTTNAAGEALFSIYPPASAYTYSLSKVGYTPKYLQPLGGYGETGGTVYDTLVLGNATLPAGYTRTTVYAADGETGNTIVGATLNIKDVQNASWVNATSTATGTIIDVLDGHTLNIYGNYPGVYNASMELGATPGGPYYLPMFMYRAAPVGYVYLYVTVRDVSTGLALLHSPVTAKLPTSATTGENTGSSGTASFLLPNNTIIIIGASSPGYNAQSVSTTTETVNKHIYVDLTRSTVATPTPVVTDPITGDPITPQPTVDARTNLQKDSDLLNILRSNGENIMWLCILAIMFGLLKMIVKF